MTAGAAAQAAPAVRVGRATASRRVLPGAVLVSAATGASGVLTYAFLVVAARALGPAAYGRIGVLWAAMFIAAIVVFRPLEQTASQAIAARAVRAERPDEVVQSVARVALVLLGAVVCSGLVAWPLVQARLFDGSFLLTAMLLGGICVYGISYVVRGVVGGIRWFQGYALALIADSLGRLLMALPLLLAASTAVAALAVAAAGAVGALVPLAVGRGRIAAALTSGAPSPYRFRSAAAFALPAAVVAACDQIVVNGPPLLVALDGASSSTVGVVFAATMLLRAPVYVFQGLAASLLPNFTHLQGNDDGRGRLRTQILRLAGLLAAIGIGIIGATAFVGPRAMQLLYGDRYGVSRLALVLLAVSVAGYLLAATMSQALLAARRAWTAASGWLLVAVCFVTVFVVAPGHELDRVAAALAAAILLGCVVLGATVAALVRR